MADTNKKPLIGSDKAKDFKQKMFNRNGLKRQSGKKNLKYCSLKFNIIFLYFLRLAQQMISLMKKRKYVK